MSTTLIKYGDNCHVNKPGDPKHGKMGLVMGNYANADVILRFVDGTVSGYNPAELELFVQVNEYDFGGQ